jgi:hypothetical protein
MLRSGIDTQKPVSRQHRMAYTDRVLADTCGDMHSRSFQGFDLRRTQALVVFSAAPLCIAMWSLLSLSISYCGSSAVA